jgi:5-methylcytosine-specific restriction endonuclease McrA
MMQQNQFREPIDKLFKCAEMLAQAADAHMIGNRETAATLIKSTNLVEVREWLDSIWGKRSPYVLVRRIESAPRLLAKHERQETRMPSAVQKRQLHLRDGLHCRFCGIPVIHKEVRTLLHREYPSELPWGKTNATQHSAFQALWTQYDHILPHARGGTNEMDNMIITCAACNFGRMNYTLEEAGLNDPRLRKPVKSNWNGLEHLLSKSAQIILPVF